MSFKDLPTELQPLVVCRDCNPLIAGDCQGCVFMKTIVRSAGCGANCICASCWKFAQCDRACAKCLSVGTSNPRTQCDDFNGPESGIEEIEPDNCPYLGQCPCSSCPHPCSGGCEDCVREGQYSRISGCPFGH